MPVYTEEQKRAIQEEGENILISAGAGSGKTAVLSERVLRKVKEGTPITRLLILTFTKKAAGEMKERIRKKLAQEEMEEALSMLDNSYITTFDSFALSVVKKYHVELGLPKEVGITEEALLTLMKKEQLEVVFEELYQNEEEDFLDLLSSFALKDDNVLKESILEIEGAIEKLLDKDSFFQNYEEHYYGKEHLDFLVDSYLSKIKEKKASFETAGKALLSLTEGNFQEKLKREIEPYFSIQTYNDLKNQLEKTHLPSLPKNSEEEVKQWKKQCSSLLKEIKELCCYEEEEDILEELLQTKKNTVTILKIVQKFDSKLEKYKRENEMYGFMDLAKFALSAVRDFPFIASELKDAFDEVLVDEYQDTSDIQEAFLSYITKNNLYMVGDMKQSIYRFRNANPLIFKQKYDSFKKKNGGITIDLSKNFRSRKEVLDDINLLFSRLMDDILGGVIYQEGHAMIFGNKAYSAEETHQNQSLEVYTYEMKEKDPFERYEKEIFLIAEDIQKKMKEGYLVLDQQTNLLRPVRYSDFAILLDRSKYFDTYKKIFEYVGIPLSIEKDDTLQSKMDIALLKNMFSLAFLIQNKKWDASFRHAYTSLARSFLYQMKDDEIYLIFLKKKWKETPLYQTFEMLADSFRTTPPSRMLLNMLEATSYEEKLIEIGNVSTYRKRMEYFYELAKSVEKQGKSNQDFLFFLTNLLEEGVEVGVSYQKEDTNSVLLMSIHKSKGLEFPICYFTDFHHPFNLQEIRQKIKFHEKYGILLPNLKEEEESKTLCQILLKEEMTKEEVSEKIRLFYVALTRAKEKIILITEAKDKEDVFDSLSYDEKIKALSFEKLFYLLYDHWKEKENRKTEIPLLTKQYLYPRTLPTPKEIEVQKKISFVKMEEITPPLQQTSFSKTMQETLSQEQQESIALGLRMHAIFETLDFKNPNYEVVQDEPILLKAVQAFVENEWIQKMLASSKIYREYEFLEEMEHTIYHGIIDLLLLCPKEAIIIDYKLKQVEDPAYQEQLRGYKKVIEKRINLPVRTFLYSILDQSFKEIFDK